MSNHAVKLEIDGTEHSGEQGLNGLLAGRPEAQGSKQGGEPCDCGGVD